MPEVAPTTAGWHPDPAGGGTAYWDGSVWTGDVRPPRRRFAAQAHHRDEGVLALVLGGALPALGFSTFWLDQYTLWSLVHPKPHSTVLRLATGTPAQQPTLQHFLEALATFAVSLTLGLALAAFGVYLLRGRGPTTQAVELRLARERRRGRRAQWWLAAAPVIGSAAGSYVDARQRGRLQLLWELDDLHESGLLTDEEFEIEKDKVLGEL